MAADIVATYYAPGEFPDGTSTVLDEVPSLSFLANFRDAGTGKVEQMLTATTKPDAGGIIAFDVLGTRAFAARCKRSESQTVAENVADQRATWDMPGHLEILSKGLINPPNGEGSYPPAETVSFNWTHPDFDDSGWATATSMTTVGDAQAGGPNQWGSGVTEWSADWTEATSLGADILGPSDGDEDGVSDPNAADQNHYFRQHITIPSQGQYQFYANADNYAEFYIDGVLIGSSDGWTTLTRLSVDLSAGDHVVGTYLRNNPQSAGLGGNPTGVAWAMYGPTGYPLPFVAMSVAADSVSVEYQASPPGMSWGQAWRLALQPHIDAGQSWAVALDKDFDDVNDSNGDPWPTDPNISVEVGRNSLLDLWLKGQQSYMDGWMDPNDWTLHAYNFGAFTPASGVALESPGAITSLTHKTEDAPATRFLIRSDALGWSSVGTGEDEAYLEFGVEVAAGDVATIGQKVLDRMSITRREITATYECHDPITGIADTSLVPWLNANLVPGCLATAPDLDGTPAEERVLALGCGIGENAEHLQVQITLKDRIEELNERIITELKG